MERQGLYHWEMFFVQSALYWSLCLDTQDFFQADLVCMEGGLSYRIITTSGTKTTKRKLTIPQQEWTEEAQLPLEPSSQLQLLPLPLSSLFLPSHPPEHQYVSSGSLPGSIHSRLLLQSKRNKYV